MAAGAFMAVGVEVSMAVGVEVSMAAGVEVSMAADLEVSAEGVADSAAVGADLAGVAVGAGAEAGVGTAGDAAGVGVIPVGAGELASALVGAGVRTGEATRMGMAIPIITPTIRIPHMKGRTGMHRRTRIGITAPIEIRGTTRSGKIRAIPRRRDRLAQTTPSRG
jgi:hypothetical protein